MVVLSFLKDQSSVYFGTTHLLLRTEALRQLESLAKEQAIIVRSLPSDPTLLVNYVKSKFLDANRNREIRIKSADPYESSDEEVEVDSQLLSKCSSRQILVGRNESSTKNLFAFGNNNAGNFLDTSLNSSMASKSSALFSSYQAEIDKKIMSYKQKENRKPKAEIDTKYTRALKQYLRKPKRPAKLDDDSK